MSVVATTAVTIVAIIHIAIAVVEIFFWGNPTIYGRLGFTAEVAKQIVPIIQNAGLYNGFIAVGLMWGAFTKDSFQIKLFFLICIVVAGVFGAFTLRPTTLVLQSIPALFALTAVLIAHYRFKS